MSLLLRPLFPVTIFLLLITVGCGGNKSSDSDGMVNDSTTIAPDETDVVSKNDEPSVSNGSSTTENQVPVRDPEVENAQPRDIVYEGTATDEQTGISQDYTLYLKTDLRSASIGGGPFYAIEDQGNGTYMWLDGAIIGMSIQPMRDKCIVYGSEGSYFCTLYRRN